MTWSQNIYDDFCQFADSLEFSNEEIDAMANFTSCDCEKKNKKRAVLCKLFTSDNLDSQWSTLKNQLNILFNSFKEFGLFILTKGSIESYYITPAEDLNINDKVDKSVRESETITDDASDSEKIFSSYQDVIDCLKFASRSEYINEAKAVRDELLAFITPIHARYAEDETNLDGLGSPSSIFSYKINDNEKLEVSLLSKILDVQGFPIILEKDDDVRKIVNHKLNL